ncbi:ribonuclease P protein component [Virgibacillus sp. MSP4-1]|uniref:ribonuclease P protein component n=1 Tax=Virgibacillus sp. MSP4-1 TaxID=2700081 RepID=UPI0003A02837|nr:ribonuclease P protein component [Virgibacillus sp. MSP4-1]QHS23833.1 ribonuclease P protein component [Virgibacillus sp. MSP4-1]
MKKAYRIKKNKEFQTVFKKGKSFANRQFVLYYYHKPEQQHFRVGLSVGKRLGNAVLRNQVKRYIRQALLELDHEIKQQYDYVIIARYPARELNFFQVKKSVSHVFRKSKLFIK